MTRNKIRVNSVARYNSVEAFNFVSTLVVEANGSDTLEVFPRTITYPMIKIHTAHKQLVA